MRVSAAVIVNIIVVVFCLSLSKSVFALGMMGRTSVFINPTDVSKTAEEEAEGRDIWDTLQSKQISCNSLTNDDFEVLGEYFMGQSLGNTQRHAAMNQMMKNMMGDQGEEQMHIALGKRFSGCDTSAPFPESGEGFVVPMLGMMGGGGNRMMDWGWNHTTGWEGPGLLIWLPALLLWILVVLGLFLLFRYTGHSKADGFKDKTPLDILKERYAKGEINKQEFEEKKKDLI